MFDWPVQGDEPGEALPLAGAPVYDALGERIGVVSEPLGRSGFLTIHTGRSFGHDHYAPRAAIAEAGADGVRLTLRKGELRGVWRASQPLAQPAPPLAVPPPPAYPPTRACPDMATPAPAPTSTATSFDETTSHSAQTAREKVRQAMDDTTRQQFDDSGYPTQPQTNRPDYPLYPAPQPPENAAYPTQPEPSSGAEQARQQLSATADQLRQQAGQTLDMAQQQVSQVVDQARQQAAPALDAARQQASQVADLARQQVGALGDVARQQASNQLSNAATGVAGAAVAAGAVGDQLRRADHPALSQYADRAAQQLEGVAAHLRDLTPEEALRELEDLARKQPALFLAGAFALGLLGARFLKSSGHAVNPSDPTNAKQS